MKSEEITYENMVDKMIEALPELRSAFAKESASWTEVQGPHIIYSFVLYDSLKSAMNALEANQALIQRIFDFLEILANHPEEHVQEVVHNSVCENICSDEIVLQKAQKFMGKRTREFCAMILGSGSP